MLRALDMPELVNRKIGQFGLQLIWRLVMSDHRPYAKHLEAHPDTPLSAFLDGMDTFGGLFGPSPEEAETRSARN